MTPKLGVEVEKRRKGNLVYTKSQFNFFGKEGIQTVFKGMWSHSQRYSEYLNVSEDSMPEPGDAEMLRASLVIVDNL